MSGRYSFDFDYERNEAEMGIGFPIYEAPLALSGGFQANIDESAQVVAPNIVAQLKSLPDWLWYVALAIAALWFINKLDE